MTMTEKTIVYSSLGRDMHVFEVDTGKDARSWTVQLTDPGQTR